MRKKIKIAIAEDHDLVRQGMVALLKREKGLRLVFDVGNGKELLDQLKITNVDVVLLDLNMPIIGGLEALRVITAKYPEVKVIIISMHYEDGFISESIGLGARGFLPKNVDFERVVDAVFSVYEKGFFIDDKVTKTLLYNMGTKANLKLKSSVCILTERENDVLHEICLGKSNLEIANFLGISVRTVETHKRNLLIKTKRTNGIGLLVYAISHGLFTVSRNTLN